MQDPIHGLDHRQTQTTTDHNQHTHYIGHRRHTHIHTTPTSVRQHFLGNSPQVHRPEHIQTITGAYLSQPGADNDLDRITQKGGPELTIHLRQVLQFGSQPMARRVPVRSPGWEKVSTKCQASCLQLVSALTAAENTI